MITRAKSLLIIVGDSQTLSSDKNWKELIDYIEKERALIRKGKPLHPRIIGP